MKFGAMSVSLTVKDAQASIQFYQTLGFEKFAGEESDNWIILKTMIM
jgi:predicted lactoylglutathione lyase